MIYALLGIAAAFCAYIQWGDEIPIPHIDKDMKNLNGLNLKENLQAI